MSFVRRVSSSAIESLEDRRLMSVGDPYAVPTTPRATVSLNSGWKFTLSPPSSPQAMGTDDSGWSNVTLPHTWNALDAQDGGYNYYRGAGWYRKTITAPAGSGGDAIYLHFDGASVLTDVYVDGVAMGEHAGAYGAFNVDLTGALSDGKSHVLAIKCDNSASLANTIAPTDGADLNVYGGIYRSLSLIAVAPQRVTMTDSGPGVYFSTPSVSSASAAVQIKTNLADSGAAGSVIVHSVLADASGKIVFEASSTQSLSAGGSATLLQNGTVTNPHLWNGVKDPYLHDLYVEVRDATTGALLDLVHQQVGIRSFAMDANKGFLLNGQPYSLHGTFYHPERLNEGSAISDSEIIGDLNVITDIGATVIRSQYELPPLVYQVAAQRGLIVQSEVAFNGSDNRLMTVSHDAFLANAKQQLLELMRQTYDSPSVVSYSLYNELLDNSANDDIVKQLNAFAKAEDPSRVTTGASWNKKIGGLEKLTDVVTLNRYYGFFEGQVSDLPTLLDALHTANPSTVIGVSEWGATSNIGQHGDNLTQGAKDYTQTEEFQSRLIEATYPILASRPWLWTNDQFDMFDFANDRANNGPQKGRSNYGLVSIDRQTKKDPFYYFQANWTTTPVLHLNSKTWTTRKDQATDIKVYSNLGAPTLTINGKAVAMQSLGYDVYVAPGYLLSGGANTVVVTAAGNGKTYTDSANWTYTGSGTGTNPPPPATGSISGVAFDDTNANGTYDTGDTLANGRTIFLDTDNDGVLDSGETSVVTPSSGAFTFANLPAGTYHVREVYPTGMLASTTPPDVTLAGGQNVTGLSIGAKAAPANPPGSDPTTFVLQAEDATLGGGTYKQSNHGNFTGTGFADYGNSGSSAKFTLVRSGATGAALTFRYSNGGSTARPLTVTVNGTVVGTIACDPTGSWENWSNVSITAPLLSGTNTIIATAGAVGGGNLDSLTVVTTDSGGGTGGSDGGNPPPSPVTLQAEDATMSGGTYRQTNHAGFTGSGFSDYGGSGSAAKFTLIRDAAGQATLTFRYSNGASIARRLSVLVNGISVGTLTCAPTGSWDVWADETLTVPLVAGTNVISAVAGPATGGNLDSVRVS